MSQDQEQRLGEERHVRRAEADCRDRDCHAGAGWGCEHGSWVSGVEALGNVQGLQMKEAGAQAPGGLWKTLLPSCGGG